VAFHDDTLDRVTMTSGQVNSLTYTQLTKLDLAPKHPLSASFNNVRIPSVEQFVAECLSLNLKIIIDLKNWDLPDETVNLILSLNTKFPTLKTNSIITSFFPNLLYKLRSSDPHILTAVSTRPHFWAFSTWEGTSTGMRPRFSGMKHWVAMCLDMVYTPMLEQLLWWMVGISAVFVHRAVVTKEYVDMWKRKGMRVMAWTVNCPLEKQFMRRVLGVQVLTDTMEKVMPARWRSD
jgi:glycerophosphoinositol glycerophosphodiesterase